MATLACTLVVWAWAGTTLASTDRRKAGEGARTGQCGQADVSVAASSARRLRSAFLCLVNTHRASTATGGLVPAAALRRSADRHSRDMVTRGFFGHTSPGGRTLAGRVRRTGYLKHARRWKIGETLAYGGGDITPRELFAALMRSPAHRTVITDGGYRQLGVGLERGVPAGDGAGLTVTLNFGVVRGRRQHRA